MFRALFLVLTVACTAALPATAQTYKLNSPAGAPATFFPTESILNNSVTNLHAEADSLWVGPFLNLTTDGGDTWQIADADSLAGSRNRVFSIDVEGRVAWSGLGFVDVSSGDDVQSAGGFTFSEDGGQTWHYRAPHLDSPADTTIQYGVSMLSALAVIVPQQSPPFDIDYVSETQEVWLAGWASGIRRSSDDGASWQRVVLPPDDLDAIHPDTLYDFKVEPRRGETGNLNHMGFSVLIDEAGTVWAGTPAGVNRSLDGGKAWRKFQSDGTPETLTGNWVISIEEQPVAGRNPIWMATWNGGDEDLGGRFGVTVTRDGGETFEQLLIGSRVYDFAFDDGIVYAAGEAGLFVSRDDGRTWITVRDFTDASQPDREVRRDVRVFSVAVVAGSVWAGTSDGLFRSDNQGGTWRMFRVEVPLNPDEPSDRVPTVETFAYPNPFSPQADQFVRIRFEVPQSQGATVRVYDYAMSLVREISADLLSAGTREVSWDGRDAGGMRVANGVYLYSVDAGSGAGWGKILLIE